MPWCRENLPIESEQFCAKQLRFDGNEDLSFASFFIIFSVVFVFCSLSLCFLFGVGFFSWFLYKRLYRCHTTLDGFAFDKGNVERKEDPPEDDFYSEYDGKKPVFWKKVVFSWI